jgi:hypothetical protein
MPCITTLSAECFSCRVRAMVSRPIGRTAIRLHLVPRSFKR